MAKRQQVSFDFFEKHFPDNTNMSVTFLTLTACLIYQDPLQGYLLFSDGLGKVLNFKKKSKKFYD